MRIRVEKLVALLSMMPQEAEVYYFWDGAARSAVERVWLSKSGVILGDDETMPGQIYAAEKETGDTAIVPGHWSNL